MRRDDELEHFKTLNLGELAASYGYALDSMVVNLNPRKFRNRSKSIRHFIKLPHSAVVWINFRKNKLATYQPAMAHEADKTWFQSNKLELGFLLFARLASVSDSGVLGQGGSPARPSSSHSSRKA